MEAQASLFRMSEHKLIAPKLEQMKSELVKYNTIVKAIKPLEQRLKDGKDTFSLLEFWRANEGEVPAFAYVVWLLRAVLANAPNCATRLCSWKLLM